MCTFVEEQACDIPTKVVEVQTGEVKAGRGQQILVSGAIGSCIAIVAYDAKSKVGAIAHVMLPGRSPREGCSCRTRYAADAIDEMIDRMTYLGAKTDDIEACLVGGANVLRRGEDTIWKDNIDSVLRLLREKHIRINVESLGGTKRRTVRLDIEKESVYCAEANESERLLWKTIKGGSPDGKK